MISYEDFKKAEIKIGKIIIAEKIPDTDKLLFLKVDLAEESPRVIISGIAPYFPDPSNLVGVKRAFVTNLEHRVIRGYESKGMILAVGGSESQFSFLRVDENVKEGNVVK